MGDKVTVNLFTVISNVNNLAASFLHNRKGTTIQIERHFIEQGTVTIYSGSAGE